MCFCNFEVGWFSFKKIALFAARIKEDLIKKYVLEICNQKRNWATQKIV